MDHDLEWIKSKRSNPSGNCVELAVDGRVGFLRNSRTPEREFLAVSREVLADFILGAKDGDFDEFLTAEEKLQASFPDATEVRPVGGWVSGSCPDPVKAVPVVGNQIDTAALLRRVRGEA